MEENMQKVAATTIIMVNIRYPHNPDLANGDNPYFGET